MHRAGCSRTASSRPRFELADLIREHGDTLRARHAVSSEQGKVLRALAVCRTAALGGHLDRCLDCGHERPAYNSCRNRHCPKCQALDQARWLACRMKTLLPVPYFHVVFTLPGELSPLVLRNRRRLFTLLFRAAAATLLTLGTDPDRLGGQLGATLVLHTWTRELRWHAHIHAVVTGGALTSDRQRWVSCDAEYLFPVRVISKLFRGKMLDLLRREQSREPLDVPVDLESAARFDALVDRLYETDWVTYAKAPFGGPRQVLAYLGRYTHRVALSNHRLLEVTAESVTLRTRGTETTTVAPVELLRRFLLHVLPTGFVRIRHYGLLASANLSTKLADARRILETPSTRRREVPTEAADANDATTTPPAAPDPTGDWRTLFATLTGIDTTRCPACGSQNWHRFPLDTHLPSRGPPRRTVP